MSQYRQRQTTVFNRDELKREAILMHKAGERYSDIAREIGVDPDTVHGWVDPAYGKRRAEAAAARKRAKYAETRAKKGYQVESYKGQRRYVRPDPVRDGAVLPPKMDTRDLTARLLGDPVPGRRAIDKGTGA